jgi:hypothetical protein
VIEDFFSGSWVDFAEEDRREMAEVISLFRERDTRDELGIGVIRDALADLMFPGTSTIQTRARYFLFIPGFISDWRQSCFGACVRSLGKIVNGNWTD